MSVLLNLQEMLQAHLFVGDDDDRIADQLMQPAKGALADRLAIYVDAYRLSLIDALEKEYVLIQAHLGEEAFIELSDAYIDEHPSRFFSIGDFTKEFPDFLVNYHAKKGYLSELATLIRALSLSRDAADEPPLNQTELADIPLHDWPLLCFRTHPSVYCLTFQWNTFEIWKALVEGTALPSVCKEVSHCVIWRKELQAYVKNLAPLEYLMLRAWQEGRCFSDVCELVCTNGMLSETDAAGFVAGYVARCLNDQFFLRVDIP